MSGRAVTPPYLPPPTGRTCKVCGEDELNHRDYGLVCRNGHRIGCACDVHSGVCPAIEAMRGAKR